MRNKSANFIENLAARMNKKTQKMVDKSVNGSYINQNRDVNDIRGGYLKFGALQMSNYNNNDYAIFGAGWSSNIVGP